MLQLNGPTAIFTDVHFGIKNNSPSRLKLCVDVLKQMVAYIKQNDVKNVIFCGDYFHNRSEINILAMNVAKKCMNAIAKHVDKVVVIVGNHDCFYKNSTDVNSLTMFNDIPNVAIFTQTNELMLNGQKCLCVPWLGQIDAFPNDYQLLFGHFDISAKYLLQAYIEDNAIKKLEANEVYQQMIDSDQLLETTDAFECANLPTRSVKSEELIGDFMTKCVPGGIVYAGHIHNHKEAKVKRRTLIFVGSPYQQNFGEKDSNTGFYALDSHNNRTFVELDAPKHIEVKMSAMLDKSFDFSIVTGNIIKRIYDVEVKTTDDIKVQQNIAVNKPFEEAPPEYDITVADQQSIVDNAATQHKSKLDSIKNYIDNVDDKFFKEKMIDRDKLETMLQAYYATAQENLV